MPGSGRLAICEASGGGGTIFASETGVHCSKSLVEKTLPDAVRAYKTKPSAEYQTRSTGPVASEGSARSMAELPMWRQSRLSDCEKTKPVEAPSNAVTTPN